MAQTTTPCPEISVEGPSSVVRPGEAATFTATLKGDYDQKKIEYLWTTSEGVVSEGQGTSVIKVPTKQEMNSYNITATLEIKGLPPHCQNTASDTAAIQTHGYLMLLDEYEKLPFAKEKIRLDAIIKYLKEDEERGALLMFYGSGMRPGSRASVLRQKNINAYLADKGITSDRFRLIFTGIESPSGSTSFTKIWIVSKENLKAIVN